MAPPIENHLRRLNTSFPITIKDATPSDFYRITEYYFRFYDEIKENNSFGLALFDEKPGMLNEMEGFVQDLKHCSEGNAIYLLAESEQELVGICFVHRERPRTPNSHRGGIEVNVKKEHRGRGIGSKLLEEMIRRCKGKFEILELEVFSGNQPAKRLYEKAGFKTYGVRPDSVKRNGEYFDEELMYLKI